MDNIPSGAFFETQCSYNTHLLAVDSYNKLLQIIINNISPTQRMRTQ